MGRDIRVKLIYGYRISLAEAFENEWLSPSIIEGDDWQLLDELVREEWVNLYIPCEELRDFLIERKDEWGAYILSSMQDECDPEASFLYIYNNMVDIDTDSDTLALEVSSPRPHPSLLGMEYKPHLTLYNSY